MTQIKILDKEKDYLLSVNAQQFVDSLNSASIFYELLSYDKLNLTKSVDKTITCKNTGIGKTEFKRIYPFNNISLVGIYNSILNLICHNLYEGLAFRHHIIYKKEDKKFDLYNFNIQIRCINYKDKDIKSAYDYQEYEFLVGTNGFYQTRVNKIQDNIKMSYGLSIFEHEITLGNKDMSDDFLPKMLILYQDFADNIPI